MDKGDGSSSGVGADNHSKVGDINTRMKAEEEYKSRNEIVSRHSFV